MTSDLLTVKLEKLTYGGDALGRLSDGRAVFVPFALPGETVRIHSVNEKRGHVRAELVEVLEPSHERIAPKCKHFGVCGGCHYQHLPYQAQLSAKTEILRDQLKRIGKIENPPVKQIVPSSTEWNYRNHVQFHLTRDGKLGYIDAQCRSVIPISECHLPELPLNILWPTLEFDPGLGLERVSLRLGVDDETMLVLESESPETPELELEANLSVVHLTDNDVVVMAGDDHLTMIVNDRLFHVSAASFFQVNTEMAGKMAAHLLAHLRVSPATTLLDVYCGVGLFSAFFAPRVGRLIGIESSLSACEDFAVNLDKFDNVELYEAPAENVLPALDVKPDTVIVDPPRAGLEKRSLDALLVRGPARIAYVSCEPSTLARDAARLIAGCYRLVQVTPFDLFPQTYHIESISIFEKG
ncbi:MAG: class I SAM-dependent RNA methyltransferase [Anaerolineales bacterium]|nr:class I SAM-dependent RNA methyltransferase [Anaerolineales bacterium]